MKDVPSAYAKLSEEQFSFLTEHLSVKYGLHIPPAKKTLLESRLVSRVDFLKLKSIEEYIQYVFKSSEGKQEYPLFVEQITTHKTFFFRENYQFDFLSKILPTY